MKIIFKISLILIVFNSCNKDKPKCYSRSLENKFKNNACQTDCPGVIGCDDVFYCNECEANRKGIKIK